MSDTGTGAMVNLLANPPNPYERLGQTVNALTAARQYRSQQAVGDIYNQSIDPTTGQLDMAKFNARVAADPDARMFAGPTMQKAGEAVGAQGYGVQQHVAGIQARLGGQASLLAPLTAQIEAGQDVTGDQVLAAADRGKKMGFLDDNTYNNIVEQVRQIPAGGNANTIVIGATHANEVGMAIARSVGPQPQTFAGGGENYVLPTGPFSPATGNVARGGVISQTPSADTMSEIVEVPRSDGLPPVKRSRQEALGMIGSPVPGAGRGVTYFQPPGGFKPPSQAVPAPARRGAPRTPQPTPGQTPTEEQPPGQTPTEEQPAPAEGEQAPAPVPQGRVRPVPQPPLRPPMQTKEGGVYGQPAPFGTVPLIEESVKQYASARDDAVDSSQRRVPLIDNAMQALEGVKTGPGTQTIQQVRALIGTYLGGEAAKESADYSKADKYLTQLASSNAGAIGGSVTNDKLAAAQTSTPNVHIEQLGTKDLLGVIRAQEKMLQFMVGQAQDQGVTPQQWTAWKSNWARSHDPRAFLPFDEPHREFYKKTIKPGSREDEIFRKSFTEYRSWQKGQEAVPPPGQD